MDNIYTASLAALFAGLATVLGFIPLLFISKLSKRSECICLSFAAGVMIAASFFSLLNPSFDEAAKLFPSSFIASSVVLFGFALGVAFIWVIDRYVTINSIEIFKDSGAKGKESSFLANLWIFVLAIMIHNFPEGMAVGVGFSTGDPDLGLPIGIGIALQNIPEGLVVAVACLAMGYSKTRAFLICLISGLVEPVGGFFGILLVSISQSLLPIGLSFAAGAMLFAIIHKMMFEIHNYKMQNVATLSCIIGLIVMTILDRIF